MSFSEYERYDATGLAHLIREKELTALEVIETAIDQVEKHNPTLNAVVATLFEAARESVKNVTPKGPFGGVPFLLKDLNTHCADLPSTNGSYAFKDVVPTNDSVLVSRYRASGLVVLGKTNTPELGLNVSTEPALFGATKNPHDHTRSPGGSSGGSAAAVASGMLPAAHATDSGGSIRIPASNCGLFGLKPSRSRVPLGNDAAEGMAGFSTVNAVSHSVRDSALLLDVASGPVAGDPYTTPPIHGAFVDELNQPIRESRIALCTQGFAGEKISAECVAAAKETALKCEALGCHVEEDCPDIQGQALRDVFDVLFAGNIRALVTSLSAKKQAWRATVIRAGDTRLQRTWKAVWRIGLRDGGANNSPDRANPRDVFPALRLHHYPNAREPAATARRPRHAINRLARLSRNVVGRDPVYTAI